MDTRPNADEDEVVISPEQAERLRKMFNGGTKRKNPHEKDHDHDHPHGHGRT